MSLATHNSVNCVGSIYSPSCSLGLTPELHSSTETIGGRLRRNGDGTLEVIPKAPMEVVGEYILRPAIDVIVSVFQSTFGHVLRFGQAIDNVVRGINILPMAEAAATAKENVYNKDDYDPESCPQASKTVSDLVAAALNKNEVNYVTAAKPIASEYLRACQAQRIERMMKNQHARNLDVFEEKIKARDKALSDCKAKHGESCYRHNWRDQTPRLEAIPETKSVDGEVQTTIRWKVHPGYLYWSIYVDYSTRDQEWSSGMLNWDTHKDQPTISE